MLAKSAAYRFAARVRCATLLAGVLSYSFCRESATFLAGIHHGFNATLERLGLLARSGATSRGLSETGAAPPASIPTSGPRLSCEAAPGTKNCESMLCPARAHLHASRNSAVDFSLAREETPSETATLRNSFFFMFSTSRVPMPATGAACVGTPVLELAEPGSGTLSMLGAGDAAWPGCSALIRAGDAAWPGCSALLGAGGAAWLGLAEPGPPASASKRCCSAASRILQSARTSLSSRHVFVPCLRVATPREAAYFMSSGFRISSTLPPIAPGSRRGKDRLPTQTWPRRRR